MFRFNVLDCEFTHIFTYFSLYYLLFWTKMLTSFCALISWNEETVYCVAEREHELSAGSIITGSVRHVL